MASPPPNLAEIYPSRPRGAWQSPALLSGWILPARKGFSLSCFLPSMATQLLHPSYMALMLWSGFPRCAWHRPGGLGWSPGATKQGSITPSRGCSGAGCWLGGCWGGREEHPPSPTQASSSSSPSVPAGHGALGPPGWFQRWSPWGELGGGGGTGGMRTYFPQHRQLCGGRLWSGGHSRWHPPSGEGPLSIPGRSRCLGPVSVPSGVEESAAGWGPYWAHLFPATAEGTAQLRGCLSSNKD